MVYADEFNTITLNGTLAGGNEIFSCGIHMSYVPPTEAEWIAFMDEKSEGLVAACEDMFSSPGALVPYDAHLTSVKVAAKGTDGKYLWAAREYEANARGYSSNAYLPQGALVTTFVADKFKDPGKYNRFYLPIATGGLLGNWRLDSGQQGAYAAVMANFVGELNDLWQDGPTTATFGVMVVSNTGTGSELPVVAVRVGQIVDTQRRRRNQLNEEYVTEPVVAIP